MRIIRTFVLRLLVDTESLILRGTVRAVEEEAERPFVGEEALLALVREMVGSHPRGKPGAAHLSGNRKGDEDEREIP